MDSLLNSTKHVKKSKHQFSWNYFTKQKGKEHHQFLLKKPVLYQY